MKIDEGFQSLLKDILDNGVEIQTRNSVCKRVTNQQITFDETPLLSIRRTAWKSAIREMEWFLSGSNNIDDLHPSVHKWWKPWADKASGLIPNNYGQQFRSFYGRYILKDKVWKQAECDQLGYLMHAIKHHPYSRRSVITTWNTAEMVNESTPITNCHGTVIQAFVDPDDSLHLTMYQRSSDMVLGLPHNFIQYWALLLYLVHHTGRKPGKFTWIGGDCHIYESHYDAAKEICDQKTDKIKTPKLTYNPTSNLFKADDFSIDSDYNPIIKKSLNMVV